MGKLWRNLTQVGNQIILEFLSEKDAKTFYDIWTKENRRVSDPAEMNVKLDGVKVFLTYYSTEDARIRAMIMIGPSKCDWNPLEGRSRCPSCG